MRWWLAIALAACSGDGGSNATMDSGTPIDAAIDAPMANVELVVWETGGSGLPDVNAIAIFYDDANNVVQHGAVDASGRAYAFLPDGGSVTVLQIYQQAPVNFDLLIRPTTVRGVKPGDSLVFGRPKSPTYQAGNVDVMTVRYTSPDGQNPSVFHDCGYFSALQAGVGQLFFYESCTPTTTFDVLALSATTPRQFVWKPGNTYLAGGEVTVPNTWQPLGTFDVTYTNVPADTSIAQGLYQLIGTRRWEASREGVSLTAGTSTVTKPYATGAGTGTVVTAWRSVGIYPIEDWLRHVPGSPSSTTIDMAAQPLPSFVGLPVQSNTGASWTESGTGSPDARQVYWEAHFDTNDGVRRKVIWYVIEPPTGTSTTLLPFPTAYEINDPTKLQFTLRHDDVRVSYIDHAHIASYDAAREQTLTVFDLTTHVDGQVTHATHSR